MESLNTPCQNCQRPMNGGVYRMPHVCPHCLFVNEGIRGGKRRKPRPMTEAVAAPAPEPQQQEQTAAAPIMANDGSHAASAKPVATAVVLSSKSADEHQIAEALEEISAECTLKIELTPDLVSNGKFVGQKSEKVKAAVAQGKKHALAKLREQAQDCGANLVTDVTIKNAIRKADAKNINIVVRASGVASITELAEAANEA